MFSRSGGAWYGPIVVSGTTLAAPGSDDPSYVLAPGALRVPESAAVSASTLANGNVRVALPAGVRPTIGQGVLVPPGLGLPLGYLGSVVAIATKDQSGNVGVLSALVCAEFVPTFGFCDEGTDCSEDCAVRAPGSARTHGWLLPGTLACVALLVHTRRRRRAK